jgi:hypothetical protein
MVLKHGHDHTPSLIIYPLLCVVSGEGLTDHRIDRWANELRIHSAALGTAAVQVCWSAANYFKHSILSTCLRTVTAELQECLAAPKKINNRANATSRFVFFEQDLRPSIGV